MARIFEKVDKDKAYHNTLRIIESCANSMQLESARKCVELYKSYYVNNTDELFHLNFMLEKKEEELSIDNVELLNLCFH